MLSKETAEEESKILDELLIIVRTVLVGIGQICGGKKGGE